MRSWSFRVVTFLFMLSVVATPFAVVNAQDGELAPGATPIEEVTPTEEVATPTETAVEPEESTTEPPATATEAEKPVETTPPKAASTPAPDISSRSNMSINAELGDETWRFTGTSAYWNDSIDQGRLGIQFVEGAEINAGDTISIWYPSETLTITSATFEALDPSPDLPATLTVSGEYLVLTFNADFVGVGDAAYQVTFNGSVTFSQCGPENAGQPNTANIEFRGDGSQTVSMVAEGEPCPASQAPAVISIEFIPLTQSIQMIIGAPDIEAAAGSVITIQYPMDRLAVVPGTGVLFVQSNPNFSAAQVGTVEVANGVITLTFDENLDVEAMDGGQINAIIEANFNTEACDPDGGNYVLETDPIQFIANPGGEFYSAFEDVLCNAVSPTLTGVMSADGGTITWTLDTGELIDSGNVQNGLIPFGNMTVDCSSIEVSSVTGTFDDETSCAQENSGSFNVSLSGEGAIRVQVVWDSTVTGLPESGSYLNCAIVSSSTALPGPQTLAREGNGYGGTICGEVFPVGGGDFITNTVSKTTAYPGDTLTYNVTVETTTSFWTAFELNNVVPQGVEVDTVTCSAAPADLAAGECEVQEDGTITFGVYHTDVENAVLQPGSITLEIQGVISAQPGTELENEACFERLFDQGLGVGITGFFDVGSGVICESAFTQVVAPPATPTETVVPTETVTPTETVVPTETATPGTPAATPTETTVPVQKQTTVRVEMWDGSGIEGATWMLSAPLASQTIADPYLTGVLDANNSTVMTDLPAGDYLFEVTPNGLAPQEFRITISDQSEEIVLQFAQPAGSATPGATAAPADPTQTAGTKPVTGLPETGNNAAQAGVSTLLVAIAAAAMMVLMAVGVRVRSSNRLRLIQSR